MPLTKHEVHKIEEKYYDKFPGVKLVITSFNDVVKNHAWSERRIVANNSPSNAAYCKQLVMFFCKHPKPCELPYFVNDINYDTAAGIWYAYLTKSNPPEERVFPFNEEFLKEVQALDFDLFDEKRANELKEKYSVAKRNIKPELDAVDIEMGEDLTITQGEII